MNPQIIILFFCISLIIVGCINFVYQLYHIVLIDASARGLDHPKLWSFIAIGNGDSNGLILYLIKRHNYPIVYVSEDEKAEMNKRKKATGIGLCFLSVGLIGLIICIMI